jgi:N-acetylglucosamine kinase-like BadF-type ATPase
MFAMRDGEEKKAAVAAPGQPPPSSSSSSSIPRHVYAGFDGGGTRTTCVLCDSQGNVLAVGLGGRSNYHDIGLGDAVASLKRSFDEALEASGLAPEGMQVEACFGLAGLDSPKDMRAMKDAVSSFLQLVPGERARPVGDEASEGAQRLVENDWRTAVKGAFIAGPGVTLIAGTGCVAAAQNSGGRQAVRVGGWGHIVDDRGSGYDIGREALYAAMRDYDGRGPETMLLKLLMVRLDVDEPQGIIARVYAEHMPVSEIASLSTLVSRAAKAGDEVALDILRQKGRVLGELVVSAASKLGMLDTAFGVSLNGGVFNAGTPLLGSLEESIHKVAPKARIVEPRLTPACGAVVLLLERANIDVDDRIVANIRRSFEARVKERDGSDGPPSGMGPR